MSHVTVCRPKCGCGPMSTPPGPLTASGIPSTFLLSAERTLLDRQVGYAPSVEDRWKKILEKHLRAKK